MIQAPSKQTLISNLLDESYSCRTYDLKRSIRLSAMALSQSRDIADQRLTGRSLNQLSLFYMISGSYKKAIQMAKEAIVYFEALQDEKGIADAFFNIGSVYYKTDNFHLGLVNLSNCLTTYRKLDDYANQARVLKSLGTIYQYFGDLKNAILSYNKAIEAGKKIKDLNILSNVFNPLSGIYLKQGKIEQAMKLIQRSIAYKEKTGDIRGMAFAVYGRGKIYTTLEQYDLAKADFESSICIHSEAGEKLGLAMAYHKLGALYNKWEMRNEAKAHLDKSLEVSNEFHIGIIKVKSNHLLYEIAKAEGDINTSLAYLEQYLQQKETILNAQSMQIIENYELLTKMRSLEKEAKLRKETAEMLEKKERAEQTARMKQDFLSTMSHEIRTPLNAVTTITALLSDKVSGDDRLLIESLKAASGNLLLVINDILDFTKLDSSKVSLELQPGNLHAILDRIRKTYEHLAVEKGIALELDVDGRMQAAYALDETKLSQILGNLISNGIKFTNTGSVTLKVQLLQDLPDADRLLLTVSDTGAGIPEEYYDQMFESFAQPKSVTTRKEGGTGLGLAIVRKLVQLYGSEIAFTSKVGSGSSFFFELVLKRTAPAILNPAAPQDGLRNKVVLLAEDNMVNAMVALRLLTKWGAVAEHVLNGRQAVERAREKPYDFVLMDIHMPEMNGFDATMEIRRQENYNQHTPIFALTADITAESQEAYASEFSGFLRKPIEIEKLYSALTNIV